MIEPDQAWRIVTSAAAPRSALPHDLTDALGLVLAEDIRADRDMPPADRSAMDGYAVRAKDIASPPTQLSICGEVAAGSAAAPHVDNGSCAAIFTGANIPPGADTVVMVEDTSQESKDAPAATFEKPISKGANIFRRGEDARKGDILVSAGTALRASHIAVCAAVGAAKVTVHARPTISLLSTGAELLEVDASVAVHQLRNSNGPMLAAALASRGFKVTRTEAVTDDPSLIQRRIANAIAESNVVLLTGGVSVGKYDLVPAALEDAGMTIRFHKVAIKPGKPVLFATSSEGQCIFGLPGNPLSALTAFHEFVLPTLRYLSGVTPGLCRPMLKVTLTADVPSKGNRLTCRLGKLSWRNDGSLQAEPLASSSVADLAAACNADGTIMVPTGTTMLAAGSSASFRPWNAIPAASSLVGERCLR